MNDKGSNPNDFKVVDFTNREDFTFTPEMGCMYDGRPIFGITGAPGINGGESMKLPYHVAQRLAVNLAKAVMVRNAPATDAPGNPVGKPLWDSVALEARKNSYLTDLYVEEKPVAMSETDKLMAKVEEYKKMVEVLIGENKTGLAPIIDGVQYPARPVTKVVGDDNAPSDLTPVGKQGYQDKAEVIAELEKRNIPHDKRKGKDFLEKLLNTPSQ